MAAGPIKLILSKAVLENFLDAISKNFSPEKDEKQKTTEYQNTEKTGIVNSSNNSSNKDTLKLNEIMMVSLYKFYYSIRKLFSRLKLFKSHEKNIVDIFNNFLEIPNFKIYFYYGNNLPPAGRILNESELEEVRVQMEQLIEQL